MAFECNFLVECETAIAKLDELFISYNRLIEALKPHMPWIGEETYIHRDIANIIAGKDMVEIFDEFDEYSAEHILAILCYFQIKSKYKFDFNVDKQSMPLNACFVKDEYLYLPEPVMIALPVIYENVSFANVNDVFCAISPKDGSYTVKAYGLKTKLMAI